MDNEPTQSEFVSPPQSKAELIERIHSSRATLEQTIGRLTDAQMTAPIADRGWSIKDILAHIAAWEQVLLHVHLEGRPFNEVTRADTTNYATDDIDDINQALYRRERERALPAVLAAFRRSYQEVLALLAGLNEADLFKPYAPAGRDPASARPLVDWIAGDTYEHYMEHLATIQALTERSAGT